ncbi:hypothetical protein MHYP_G00016770 [Metynnis hypsauchen]
MMNTVKDADIAAVFGSLETLNKCNLNDLKFVESWVDVKLLPVLSYVTKEFLTRLSQINFTCGGYQMM